MHVRLAIIMRQNYLLEKDLNGQKLVEEIDRILLDEKKLSEMKKASKQLGIPDAAKRLYRLN